MDSEQTTQWIDRHYRMLMMVAMALELVLLSLLVWREWNPPTPRIWYPWPPQWHGTSSTNQNFLKRA